jgi:hypothetical protein
MCLHCSDDVLCTNPNALNYQYYTAIKLRETSNNNMKKSNIENNDPSEASKSAK